MILVGGGGHALEVMDVLQSLERFGGESLVHCFDSDESKAFFLHKIPVIHQLDQLLQLYPSGFSFCLGIGNPQVRAKLYKLLTDHGGIYCKITSSQALVSDSAMGEFDAMSQVFVGPQAQIGIGSLINTGAKIHHGCRLGEFVEIGPGAIVLGNVSIGDYTQIGAGAVILPGVKVGENCKIGAGSVVTRDIPGGLVAFGVPCKPKIS